MHQPSSMNKVHSLDYSASSPLSSATGGRKHPALMHSVSIVVELAHEVEPHQQAESDTSWMRTGASLEKEAKEEGEVEEDNDEEEEEEEDDECLAEGLARRVVIVDEADKIERVRARSAEPEVSLGSLSGHSTSFLKQRSCEQVAHTRGSRWSAAGLRQQSNGACELAEHGELAQLSMRRNTCHQLATGAPPPPPPPHSPLQPPEPWPTQPGTQPQAEQTVGGAGAPMGARRHARSGSAQLDSRHSMDFLKHVASAGGQSSVAGGTLTPATGLPSSSLALTQGSSLRNRCHQQQRRRSLQISLLTESARSAVAGSSNQLLTEEELRGEREFNEQLRSLRSSADWTAQVSQQQQHQRRSLSSQQAWLDQERERELHRQSEEERCKSAQEHQLSSPTTKTTAKEGPPLRQLRLARRSTSGTAGPATEEQDSFWRTPSERKFFASPLWHQPPSSPLLATTHSASASPSASTVGPQEPHQQLARRNSPRRVSFCSGEPLETASATPGSGQSAESRLKRHSVVAAVNCKSSDRCRSPRSPEVPVSPSNSPLEEEEPTLEVDAPIKARQATLGAHAMEPGSGVSHRDMSADGTVAATTTPAQQLDYTRQTGEPAQTGNSAARKESSRIQSIMANARQRQEEFARLLEEHEQIVNEINRVETKISNSQQATSATPASGPASAAASGDGGGGGCGVE